jgi:hypothetical protein
MRQHYVVRSIPTELVTGYVQQYWGSLYFCTTKKEREAEENA